MFCKVVLITAISNFMLLVNIQFAFQPFRNRDLCIDVILGIHCGRYITSHGLALNCNTDMSWFSHIIPCGIEGKGVTSVSAELQRDVSVEETIPHLLDAFTDQFSCQLIDGRTPETDQDSGESSA